MAVMTPKNERILERLVVLAGNGQIVQDALEQLNRELPAPPSIEQLVERIVALRNQATQESNVHAAAAMS